MKRKRGSPSQSAEDALLNSDEMKRMESVTQDLLKVSKAELDKRLADEKERKNRPTS